MIHDDLMKWRQENAASNYGEYLTAVAALPPEKREAGLALWGLNSPGDMPLVLGVIHHLENGRRELARMGMRDRNEAPAKHVSQEADGAAYKLLDGMRRGDFSGARAGVELLEWLYVYAGSCPSRDGFRNVLHVLRHLMTHHLEPLPNLVAMGEDYDPATQTAMPHTSNEQLLRLAEKHPAPQQWYDEDNPTAPPGGK